MKANTDNVLNAHYPRMLRAARRNKKLSLREVGDRTGYCFNMIAHIENKRRTLTVDLAEKLCELYGINIDTIILVRAKPIKKLNRKTTRLFQIRDFLYGLAQTSIRPANQLIYMKGVNDTIRELAKKDGITI